MSASPPKADVRQRGDFMSFQISIISFVLAPVIAIPLAFRRAAASAR
jgi:hypothetical protein